VLELCSEVTVSSTTHHQQLRRFKLVRTREMVRNRWDFVPSRQVIFTNSPPTYCILSSNRLTLFSQHPVGSKEKNSNLSAPEIRRIQIKRSAPKSSRITEKFIVFSFCCERVSWGIWLEIFEGGTKSIVDVDGVCVVFLVINFSFETIEHEECLASSQSFIFDPRNRGKWSGSRWRGWRKKTKKI